MNDDVFDFFYEALPGYEEVGRRRILLELLGRVQQPRLLRLRLQDDGRLGQRDVRHPGHRRRRRAGHDRTSSTSTSASGSCSARSYYEDWVERGDVRPEGPARQPGRQAPPVEPDDDPEAAEARPRRRQLLVGDEPALVRQAHRRQPRDGHRRRRARAAVGDGAGQQGRHAVRQRDRHRACRSTLPKTPDTPEVDLEWKIPQWSNAIERDRARIYFVAYAAGMRAALPRQGVRGDPRRADEDVRELRRPRRGDRLRLPRGGARRALAPHGHPRRQDRQLPPVPADAVERLARPTPTARPGPYEDAVQRHADLRGGRRGQLPRASTSCARSARFDPCLPCGVHMYLGNGKTIKQVHSPMFGEHG